MGRIGFGELVVIAIIAVLLFGATRLSEIGKGLGEGIKNFKKGLRDDSEAGDSKPLEAKPDEEPKKAS